MMELLGNRFAYFQRIWSLRYFWLALVGNDLNSRYRRSFLGIGWSLLRPLAMTAIYCVVFAKVFDVPVAEYVPFLLIGMATWQYLCECLLSGSTSFVQGGAYIRQTPIPLAIFPLRTALGSGVHALIALGVGLVVAWIFLGSLNPAALLFLLPAILVLLVLGWSLAIVSGVMYTHFPDTRQLFDVALQILFYATPILYRPEMMSGRSRILFVLEWNPLTWILALVRTPILDGTPPAALHVWLGLLFVALLTTLAILLLRKLERTLIFWI